ncbi:hypothetical protein BOTCAL_0203g00050 [Botryotinia calthae]|uniref:Uncharacterized protein n=1 Tax=Botryotinia calthae TaxID=38488 RepID=A0A4Y8D1T8_9HELO|nr:hypothetical protein BOTCAL_0203g00050 [Botryotinia calthae]
MTADRIFCTAEEARPARGCADRIAQVVKLTKNHKLMEVEVFDSKFIGTSPQDYQDWAQEPFKPNFDMETSVVLANVRSACDNAHQI